MYTNEKWKDIPNYEGIYEVSNFGRIRTKEGKTTYSNRHGLRRWKSRILKYKGVNYTTGKRVTLWKNNKYKDWLVARLVCMTFHGVPEDLKMTVNHKDGDRFNNHIYNLEWLTLADNIRHAFENGLMPTQKHIKLKNEKGIIVEYKSLSKASQALGRKNGYISGQIIRKYNIVDSKGQIYKVVN